MLINRTDRDILRELASQVAEIAALPLQQETIALWKSLNGLEPARPMVMIDQIPWHEMNVDGELTLQTQDDFCRRVETDLRRTLYSWRHMPVDMVVQPVVTVPKVIHGANFGVTTIEQIAVVDADNDVVGHQYIDQLENEADLEKICPPQIVLDVEATARAEAAAHEIFDGILEVRMQGLIPMFVPWDLIVQWHPPEILLLDLAVRPEFMHRLMDRLTSAYLSLLDQLEAQGLLGSHQPTIHCTGAFSAELPAAGYDPSAPRAKDLWTCGMAQIFSSVSPDMHQEFELAYANKWYERFGLVYYGCCEPLDKKMHIVRGIPHLRKISMSPWVDQENGAKQIGQEFVFSRKPSPAFLAVNAWSRDAVAADVQETVDICKRYGCPLELILKDISTVRYEPQRLWEWADLAMRSVDA